jgi:hypothetical protein
MRIEEAKWIGKALSDLPIDRISPILELGSSTRTFRCVEKPHIEEYVHRPLRKKSVHIVHSDLKKGDGIDISGDIYQSETTEELRKVGAKCILCCNILEHVADRDKFAMICDSLLRPAGYMIITVPRSYPYHLDPIDTYFRPSAEEVANLFADYSQIKSATIKSDTYLKEILGAPNPITMAVGAWAKIALCRGGIEATKARAHRWLWLLRPYLITAVLLKKNER